MDSHEINEYREDLKSRVVRIETIVERVESQLGTLNGRTSSLEGWRSWMTGGIAILAILTTIAIGVI